MEDSIEWKEAKGGQSYSSEESEDQGEFDAAAWEINNHDNASDIDGEESNEPEDGEEIREGYSDRVEDQQNDLYQEQRHQYPCNRTFSHSQVNLSLRRNIVALADSSQHKAKPTFASDSKTIPFDVWLESAIVAISPNADLLIFANHTPEKITFLAKLRMEPINQYVTKPLDIPLDYNEQVTSLLCLPIMSTQRTALGLVDWTALVVGLSSGYIKFYTEQSICLLSLKFCDEPVISLKCQTLKNNSNGRSETHFPIIIDEVLITHKTSATVVDGLGLYENLRIAKDEVVKSGSTYEPAYSLTNLPSILLCQKWKMDAPRDSVVLDAELLGTRRLTKFDYLVSESINSDFTTPKTSARTLAFVGRNPFLVCQREAIESSAHSYTEIIGSLFSLWNKPQPSKVQLTELTRSNTISLFDRERLARNAVSSPDKRLLAVTDDFGRVLLIDATNCIVVRVWKGYRSAQCGWIEVKRDPDKRGCPHASFLVIYAPKRGLLEVWSVQRGPRVAAFNVGKNCRLLYSGYKMLNMRAEVVQKNGVINHLAEQSYSSNCYLLNPRSETIFAVEVPYTYSLYKYGDLKSRDQLLIGELSVAIQQDSEIEITSEILYRIALAESLQTSIQKIVINLSPDRVVTILENLIIKTISNYDNHSGELMTDDDVSIIELCKRIIRLCEIFNNLSESDSHDLTLPDVNQRLIDEYEEHPKEIDEFSEQLGWSTSEVLRYLSLLALDRSYRKNHLSNPWPSMGEPLAWSEFISCFDLDRIKNGIRSQINQSDKSVSNNPEKLSIKLLKFDSSFLNQDKVVKTALFMYNWLSETYYKSLQQSSANKESISKLNSSYNYLEPSSRLALLFQFWLYTKLCNHWKLWAFLQAQVGQISDELKVITMGENNDDILIKTWKQIYNLILESDNTFAAIIATASIKSDTLRMIQDNERREKLDAQHNAGSDDSYEGEDAVKRKSAIDWECLCIDAERMSFLSQQLEDVFLLNLLLNYSVQEGNLVDNYYYRIPRISVASIMRGGPTVVSDLVAQWVVQSGVSLKIFVQPYGQAEDEQVVISSEPQRAKLLLTKRASHLTKEEHAKELLHHTKTSFPCSLDSEIILVNCVWEFCRQWANNATAVEKAPLLKGAYDCLSLLTKVTLKHRLANIIYKTIFQRTFERLVVLVETNSTVVNAKNSRLRDSLARKELNMSEECLEDFVQFCCDLSEFMLQTSSEPGKLSAELAVEEKELKSLLLTSDSWWALPEYAQSHDDDCDKRIRHDSKVSGSNILPTQLESNCTKEGSNSILSTVLFTPNLIDIDTLVELNRLANLMNLIFKLKIVKAYPLSLIGDESRQMLHFDMRHLPVTSESKNRTTESIDELRHKFARKCILNIVSKLSDEINEFDGDDIDSSDVDDDDDESHDKKEDNDIKQQSKFDMRSSCRQIQVADGSSTKSMKDNSNERELVAIGSKTSNSSSLLSAISLARDVYKDEDTRNENNESMVLFAILLSLSKEWKLNCDELYLELVFELYRCNHDKMAAQISNRVQNYQTLANGLLKISSQRTLVLFGLSPHFSGSEWRRRTDKWSMFQPNLVSWLKSIQQEEMKREIACLSFSDSLKTPSNTFGIQICVLHALRNRTKMILESVTNHLEGQAARLAYDLLQLLESNLFDKLLEVDSKKSNLFPGKSVD